MGNKATHESSAGSMKNRYKSAVVERRLPAEMIAHRKFAYQNRLCTQSARNGNATARRKSFNMFIRILTMAR
jgi:hypothetical protein